MSDFYPPPARRSRNQGSVLISVILFGTILTAVVASFLRLSMGEARLAEHSVLDYSLMNLAEAGLEEALYALQTDDWSGWSERNGGADRYRVPEEIALGRNQTGSVRVLIRNVDVAPEIISEAVIDPLLSPEKRKQLIVRYRNGSSTTRTTSEVVTRTEIVSTDSLIATGGLITKYKLGLKGTMTADSYSSDPNRPAKGDQVVVASDATGEGLNLDVGGNTTIYGYLGTRGVFSERARVKEGAVRDALGNRITDGSRFFGDFAFDWAEIVEPNWSGAASLPRANGGGGGRNPSGASASGVTLGSPSRTTLYRDSNLSLSPKDVIRVVGPVKLYLENGFDLKGTLEIEPGASLEIFTPGDMSINGQAFLNYTRRPQNLRIFGTAETFGDQSFRMNGGANMEGVLYMPNASVKINGNAALKGSMVVGEIQGGNGTFDFSYDESLGEPRIQTTEEAIVTEELITVVEEYQVQAAGIDDWIEVDGRSDHFDFDAYLGAGSGS